MKDFEVKRHPDGSFALLDKNGELIDGKFVKDDGGPISVWATARTDEGQAFYVRLPVTREMLVAAPEVIEKRLRRYAEIWERGHRETAGCD